MSNFYLVEVLGEPNSLNIVTNKKILKKIFFLKMRIRNLQCNWRRNLKIKLKFRWHKSLSSLRYCCWNVKKLKNDIHASVLTKSIYLSFGNDCFPEDLNDIDFRPIFNKNDNLDKEKYRPVNASPQVWKVFERTMYIQIESFMDDKLSKLLTRFRNSYCTQLCLIN